MLALKTPHDPAREDITIKAICKKRFWQTHQAVWLSAYARYRSHRGNPFEITAAEFDPNVAKEQRHLYVTRGGGGPIARIRAALDLPCCAMCGSHHNSDLDHFLPKKDWPEFSILPANLVPCCSMCNSGVKGTQVKGASKFDRFLHPYYDRVAKKPIWFADVQPPFKAPDFLPRPLPSLSTARQARVAFHLEHILGDHFANFAATQWKALPRVLRVETGPGPSLLNVRDALRAELKRSRVTAGINGWRTALLRGVLADKAAQAYIHSLV